MKSVIIENKKAYYDYFVKEELECGIVLRGNEVKSIKNGMCNIKSVDEDRERILLAHKKEILKLLQKINEDGVTLIPLKLYFKNGKCKCLLGICKGKHNYDKRESLKEKQIKRDIERSLK